MAEQKLDVKVTESGTAVVTSQLDKLSAQLGNVEKAQEKEAAATERAAKATEKLSDGLEGWLKAQEGKFAVVDRIAGLMGKVNQTLEFLNKAYEFGKMVVEDYILKMQSLAPALDGVNARLATQVDLVKRLSGAAAGVAGAAGVDIAQLRPAELIESRRLEFERTRLEGERDRLIAEIEQGQLRQARQAEAVGGGGGIIDPSGDYAKAADELERVGFAMEGVRLQREKLIADVKAREIGQVGPARAAGPGRPQSGGLAGQRGRDIADTASGAPDQVDNAVPYGFSEKFFEGLSGGIDKFVEMAGAVREVAQAYADAADQTAAFAEATGKAAITAAVASIFAGKSVAEGISVALEAMAQQGAAEAAWWATKAIVYSFTAPALVGPALAASAGFAGVAALAGLGSALLGGGGSGGGGGGGGAAAPTSADFGPRRERDTGGGQTIVNVYNDGLTLSTENDIGRAVAASLQAVARSPGSQAGAIQINTGGSRRR